MNWSRGLPKGSMKNTRQSLLATTPATATLRSLVDRYRMRQVSLPMFCASILAAQLAFAGEILLPSAALERTGPVQFVYKTAWPSTGQGQLSIKWTDVYGRVIEDRKLPVVLTDESQVGFELDLRRAVAMQNELSVHFSFTGKNRKGEPDNREENASASFVASPTEHTWWDYETIMWQNHNAEQYSVLKTLGITAAMHRGKPVDLPEYLAKKDLPQDLLKNDLRWYLENIATDFYSEYHRWFPDRPVNWKFEEAKELYAKDPSSKEAFKRHPSLSDPEWLKTIHDRLVACARINAPYRPLFYNLGDESGIADLAAYWDFDFSDQSLAEMRKWLKERYGTLAALNQQWGTNFTAWDLVTPMTTNEAMKQSGDNFSSWGDFKEWMDVSFANAVKMGVDAVHSVDPEAYVALEGGQVPGWGGYDYPRLGKVLTAMEPYDIGGNMEILESLNPKLVRLITTGGKGAQEKWRLWYELLHGNRGLIVWDDKYEFVNKDGTVGPRGKESAPFYIELTSGVGALLINSERQSDSIAIHYSQPSLRIDWLLEQRPKGEAWVKRSSSTEEGGDFQRLRESWCRLIEDLGLQYRFVAYDQVEDGELLRGGYRVLILPHSTAISKGEADAMFRFVEQGGVLIADGEPGVFDEHGRKLPRPLLADLFSGPHNGPVTERAFGQGKAIYLSAGMLNYYRDRLLGKEQSALRLTGGVFKNASIAPAFAVTESSGEPAVGVEVHTFRNGGVNIVGLLANRQLYIEDLGPPETISNQRFEKPRTVLLTLPGDSYVYDVRAAKSLGKRKQVTIQLDPYEPTILAISPVPLPTLAVSAPSRLGRGQSGRVGLSFSGSSPAAAHVFHVDIVDPAGKLAPHYSGNVLASHGRVDRILPMALNDQAGVWTIRVRDMLTGQTQSKSVEVF